MMDPDQGGFEGGVWALALALGILTGFFLVAATLVVP